MTMPHSYHHCSHFSQNLAVEPAYFDEDAVYEMHMAASSAFKWETDKSWARRGQCDCDSDDEDDDDRVPPSAASAFQYSYSYHPGSPLELAVPCQAAVPTRRAYFSDEDDVPAEAPATPVRPVAHGEGMLRSTSESALSSVESEYELEDVESATDDTEILDYVLTAASDDTEQEVTMAETKQKWLEMLEPLAEPALYSMNMAADPEPHAQTLLAARFMDNTYTHYQFATAATEGSAARAIELGVREMFGVATTEPTELWTLVQAVFDMTRTFRTAQESAFVQCVMQMLVHLVQRDGKRIEVATVREIAGYVLALADLMRVVVPQAFPSTDGSMDVAVGVGEASPHVLGIMLHFTQYFLFNHPEVMHPIFNTALPVDAILPMQRMLAPILAQVASDCGAVRDLTNVDVAPTERGTMHPVYGLWERIHSLHVPIELHDTFAPWLQQYCTWVSTFLKETSPKEHFAGRVFETKQEFFRSAAELWFMILRKMPLAYSELSEITSALSEYLPSQHGRKIIDYAKEHFDAQKMSMLPEKMGRMMEFVGVLDRKPDDGDKQGVQHVALKSFVSSRFFTMQMKNLIAQCPNDFYRLSQTKFKHVARAANSERFKDVAQLRANRRHRKRRA